MNVQHIAAKLPILVSYCHIRSDCEYKLYPILLNLPVPVSYTHLLYIGMRQFVYNDNIGMDTDNTLQIHLFQFLAFIKYPAAGDRCV